MSKDKNNGLIFIVHLEKCLQLQSKHLGTILDVLSKDSLSKEELSSIKTLLSSIKDSQDLTIKALNIIKNSHYKIN